MLRAKTLCGIAIVLSIAAFVTTEAGESGKPTTVIYAEKAGDKRQTSLDVYTPATGINLPVVVWIHGGGWRIGDKARVEKKPQTFNEKGFVLVSINYRLHPATDYKGQGADVAKAIRWVHDHAAEFHGSPEHIFLMGHSAGAHLAALVSTEERYLAAEGLKLSNTKGTILLDGAGYDIARQVELAALPRMKELYRTVFTDDVEKQKDASPISHVEKDKSIPPFLILYVATRRDGKIQSEAFAKKLNDAGVSATVVPAANKTHATINREIGEPDDKPTAEIFKFLSSQLRPST